MAFNPEKLYDLNEVGKRIRKIRGDYSLGEFGFLAERTSKSAVHNWENGKSLPNKERLKVIAVLGRTTVQWILYGDFPDYIRTLFTINSTPYSTIKEWYSEWGNGEGEKIFQSYESAREEIQQAIIEKTIDEVKQYDWSYSDVHHVTDVFATVVNSVLKRNRYSDNLPPETKEIISAIEKQNLTEDEIDSLLDTVRDYFKS